MDDTSFNIFAGFDEFCKTNILTNLPKKDDESVAEAIEYNSGSAECVIVSSSGLKTSSSPSTRSKIHSRSTRASTAGRKHHTCDDDADSSTEGIVNNTVLTRQGNRARGKNKRYRKDEQSQILDTFLSENSIAEKSNRLRNRKARTPVVEPASIPLVSQPSHVDGGTCNGGCSQTSRRRRMAETVTNTAHVVTYITLGSDDENEGPYTKLFDNSSKHLPVPLDVSFDSENPEFSVKVKWASQNTRSAIETFKVRKYQKFKEMMQMFADRENVPIEDVILNLDDKIVDVNDTPNSINYKIYQFLDGRIVKSHVNGVCKQKKKDPKEIKVKILSAEWRRPLEMSMRKDDRMAVLYIKCAEELKIPVSQIKLNFDGEIVQRDDTPTVLELEGGEVFEITKTL